MVAIYRCLVAAALLLGVSAIYEEQLHEFDIQRYGIGFVQHAEAQNKQLFLASSEGVVASVNAATGRMDWRVLISDASIVKLTAQKDKVYVYAADQSVTSLSLQGEVLFSVPGHKSLHASSFDMIVDDNLIYTIADENMTTFSLRGKMMHTHTAVGMILSHFVSNTHVTACRTTDASACTSPVLLRISQGKVVDTEVLPVQDFSVAPSSVYGVSVGGDVMIFLVEHVDEQVRVLFQATHVTLPSEKEAHLLHSRVSAQDITYCYSNAKCHVVLLQDLTSSPLHSVVIPTPFPTYNLFRFSFTRAENNAVGYRDLAVSPTGTVHCSQITEGPARLLWSKHEELALGRKMITVDAFIEEKDTAGHSVFDFKDRLEMQKRHVTAKLSSFVSHLASLPADLLAYVSSQGAVRKKSPIDESFGLDKHYVLLSSRLALKPGMRVSGEELISLGLSLNGISNHATEDGADIPISWSYTPDLLSLSRNGDAVLTVELIPSPHHSAPATLVVSVAHSNTIASSLIYHVNVHTGAVSSPLNLKDHSPIVNILTMNNNVLLVHRNHQVTAVSETDVNMEGTYVYFVDEVDGGSLLTSLQITAPSKSCLHPSTKLFDTKPVASSYVPGAQRVHTSKNSLIHSPVKILGDNSLLIKYLNPHTVMLTSAESSNAAQDGEDGISVQAPPSLYVRLYDLVTGQVLYSTVILNAERGMVENIENQYYVCYYNTVYQRTEILSVHFYEGMISSLGPMSPKLPSRYSLFNRPPPIAQQKTYVLPKSAMFMGQTSTLYGITNKNLLVGTTTGQVYAVDTRQLDPRRHPGPATPADKEEGLMPLNLLVYLNPVDCISHNATLFAPRHVHATSTLLESTSVVTVLGVDLFFTRVMPSKAYDMLATDFNKPLLLLIIIGMGVAVVILRRMYYKQKLNQGWK